MTNPLDAWIAEVCAALGLDAAALDRDTILDVARDVAHNVARPAAPLSTFLVGLAAGARGASAATINEVAAIVTQLAVARSSSEPPPE